jgi:hypothetical protein
MGKILDYFNLWKAKPIVEEKLRTVTFLEKNETSTSDGLGCSSESITTSVIANVDYIAVFTEEDMKSKTVSVELLIPESEIAELAKVPIDTKISMVIKTKYNMMQLNNARINKRRYNNYAYELYIDAPFVE